MKFLSLSFALLLVGCNLTHCLAANSSTGVGGTSQRRPAPPSNSLQRGGMTQSDITYSPISPSSETKKIIPNAPRRTSGRQSDLINSQPNTSRPQHSRMQSQPHLTRTFSSGHATTTSGQLSQSRRLDRGASRSVRTVSDLETPAVGQRVSGRRAPPSIRVTSTSQYKQAPPSVSETRPSGTHRRTQSLTQIPHNNGQTSRVGSLQRSGSNVQSSTAARKGSTSSGELKQSRRLSRELSRPAWRH